jgi:predicted DNA-binding transcriptional regulator AlpA
MCPSNSATPSPVNQPAIHSEILTVDDLAAFLKCSRRSVYELTRRRGQYCTGNPLPVLRLPCGMRFLRSDVEQWIRRCADAAVEQGRVQ